MTFDLSLKKSATSTTKNRSVEYFHRKYLMMKLRIVSVNDDPHVLCCDVAGTKTCDQRNCCGLGWRQNWTKRCKNLVVIIILKLFVTGGEWVSGNTQVSLVSRAGNIWSRDVHSSEGAQGDVRGQDYEEQDHQLWTGVKQRYLNICIH